MVRHEPRSIGKSNYSLVRILSLVFTILFSYSSYPLRAAAVGGFALSALSFLLGGFYLLRSFFADTRVEGWTTLVVLVSAFSGFIIALLSMVGEYVVRTLNTVGADDSYHVVERVQATVSRPLRRDRRPAVRDDVPPRPARGTPRDRDGAPGRPEPKVFLADEVVERGAASYRRAWFAARRPARPCSARRAPATSSPPPPRSASARSSATRGSSSSCATRSSGRCRTGSSAAASGLEDLSLAEALERNLTGRRDWDPKRSSVSPYTYLERGRYAEQLAPGSRRSPDWCASSSSRTWSPTPA